MSVNTNGLSCGLVWTLVNVWVQIDTRMEMCIDKSVDVCGGMHVSGGGGGFEWAWGWH